MVIAQPSSTVRLLVELLDRHGHAVHPPPIDALDPEEGHVTRIVTDTAHMGVLTDPHTFAGIVHGWVADELERSA